MRTHDSTIINNIAEIILRDIIKDYRIEENNIILELLVVKLRLKNKRVFIISIS
jgi:hypothetical protein